MIAISKTRTHLKQFINNYLGLGQCGLICGRNSNYSNISDHIKLYNVKTSNLIGDTLGGVRGVRGQGRGHLFAVDNLGRVGRPGAWTSYDEAGEIQSKLLKRKTTYAIQV